MKSHFQRRKRMSERIEIEGEGAHIKNGQPQATELSVEAFARLVSKYTLQGAEPEPNPDHAKWIIRCGSATLLIAEQKPELRWAKWIAPDSPAPYGPAATMTERRLATPYVVLSVPFLNDRLVHTRVQVFYRSHPLAGLDGEAGMLYWPNLLNVSPNSYGCISWCCTQHLQVQAIPPGLPAGLNEVLHHLWGGGFNLSSEAHEGKSTFSKAVADNVDPRVTDVERWEAESTKDPRFVLSVKWKATGVTVAKLIELEMKALQVKPAPTSAQELVTIALRSQAK
jgi:hypothetical protein